MMTDINAIMSFDRVIEVKEDGSIIDSKEYAPCLLGEWLDDSSWELMNGYSGQYCYSGPIMHPSEFIGGKMEEDIRENPGIYVAVVSFCDSDECEEGCDEVDGWAVARKKED